MSDKGKSTFLAAELGRGVDVTTVINGLANHIPSLLQDLDGSLAQPVRDRCSHEQNPYDAAERIVACALAQRHSGLRERIARFIEQRPDILGVPSSSRASESPSGLSDDANPAWENFRKPAIFHGREEQIAQCLEFLLSPQQHRSSYKDAALVIHGEGGIGKTTVSRAVLAHQDVVKAFSKRRSFIACDVADSIEAFEGTLLEAFGLSAVAGLTEAAQPSRSFGGAAGEQARRLHLERIKDFLRRAPALVVLDNFETMWNGESGQGAVGRFIEELATTCSLILTIRGAPPPTLECNNWDLCLGPLAAGPAKRAFLDFSGIHDDQQRRNAEAEPALDVLLEMLDGHALSIALLGRQAKSGYRLSDLLVRYRKLTSDALALPGGRSRLDSLPVSITVSLDMLARNETSDALKLCCFMSRLQDGADSRMIEALLSDKAAAVSLAGVDCGAEAVDDDLAYRAMEARGACFRSGLIGEAEKEGRWRMLAPIREFIIKAVTDGGSPLEGARLSLQDIDSKIFGFYRDLLAWVKMVPPASPGRFSLVWVRVLPASLHHDFGNIDQAILGALSRPRLPGLLETLEGFCNYLSHHTLLRAQSISVAEKLLFMAAENPAVTVQDRLGIERCLRSFGNLAALQGRYRDKIRLLEEAAAVRDSHLKQFCEADNSQRLSDRVTEQFRYDDELRLLEGPSQEMQDQLIEANRSQRLGDLMIQQGHYDKGGDLLEKAGRLQDKVKNPWGKANSLRGLGDLAIQQGRYSEGWRLLEEARELHGAVGSRLDEAAELHDRALVEFPEHPLVASSLHLPCNDGVRQSLKFARKRQLLESAGKLYDKVHSRLGKAAVLLSLSNLAIQQNRHDEAKHFLAGARKIHHELQDPQGKVTVLVRLFDLAVRQGCYDEGKRWWEELSQIDEEHAWYRKDCFVEALGDLAVRQERHDEGWRWLEEASKLHGERQDWWNKARIVKKLGDSAICRGRYDDARRCLEELGDLHGKEQNQGTEASILQMYHDLAATQEHYDKGGHVQEEAGEPCDDLQNKVGETATPQKLSDPATRQGSHKDSASSLVLETDQPRERRNLSDPALGPSLHNEDVASPPGFDTDRAQRWHQRLRRFRQRTSALGKALTRRDQRGCGI